MRKSFAFVALQYPLPLVIPQPVETAVTSRGAVISMPLYSAIRNSGHPAAVAKVTETTFVAAAAARMF